MSFFRFNTIKNVLVTASAALATYHIYDVQTSPSHFEAAAQKLNINKEKQHALLKIFTMSGYLEVQKAWEDINRSKIFKEDTRSVFTSKLYPVIHTSGADKQNPNEVDVEHLKHELFGRSKQYFWQKHVVTTEQVEDWILYLTQNAFDRKVGQERSELNSYDWMKKYKVEYFAAAKVLGVIDRIDPTHTIYDEAWIAGASRPGVLARIMDYKWILDHGVKVNGDSKVLAGARPLWAEIDGMNPEVLRQLQEGIANGTKIDDIKVTITAQAQNARIEDGIEYIKSLAQKLGIALKADAPTIKYKTKEECPSGLFPGRTYPNYEDPNGPKLDESKMSEDMLYSVLGEKHKLHIIDTQEQNNQRPNTETTARDAAEALISNIRTGKYKDQKILHILFESNNPYIERQTLAAQRVVDQVLEKSGLKKSGYSVVLSGVGFECKEDVATVHSEVGGLFAEIWKTINDRPSDNLMYQTRDNTSIVEPYNSSDIPHLGDSDGHN